MHSLRKDIESDATQQRSHRVYLTGLQHMSDKFPFIGMYKFLQDLDEIQSRFQREMAAFQEFHDQILEPQRRMQEQLDRVLAPQHDFQKHIDDVVVATQPLMKRMDEFSEPYGNFQKQIEQLFEPMRTQELLADELSKHAGISARLKEIQASQRQWLEQLGSAMSMPADIGDRISAVTEIGARWKELSDSYLSGVDWQAISVSANGAVTAGTETVEAAEINGELEHLVADLSNVTDPTEYLNRLLDFLGKVRKPVAQILLYAVLPYVIAVFVNLTTPIYQDSWNHYSNLPKQEHTQAIQEHTQAIQEHAQVKQDAASNYYSAEELRECRFVVATRLRVRAAGTKKAEILDEIPRGKIVKVLEIAKWWTHVEYFDDEQGALQQGWVYSRFLAKFN